MPPLSRLSALVIDVLLFPGLVAAASAQQDEVTYEDLAATYEYSADLSLNAEWDEPLEANGEPVRVEFDSLGDVRVPALVGLPSADAYGDGPYPAVIFGHGLGGSKDEPAYKSALMILLQNGFAGIIIDFPVHGERADQDLEELADGGLGDLEADQMLGYLQQVTDGTTQAVKDLRRATDLLLTIDQVDPDRIGYAGVSLGAILGTVFSGVDDRLACTALIVGGADWAEILANSQLTETARDRGNLDPHALASLLQSSDPKYFAPHISAPTLLIFGGQDQVVPYEPAGKLLAELVPEPKQVVVYQESGHMLEHESDQFQALITLNSFLTEHLQPGRENAN
jgi:pimeloyl-ACP methyl ester carboxylesterase